MRRSCIGMGERPGAGAAQRERPAGPDASCATVGDGAAIPIERSLDAHQAAALESPARHVERSGGAQDQQDQGNGLVGRAG